MSRDRKGAVSETQMTALSAQAKTLITAVIACGLAACSYALWTWKPPQSPIFFAAVLLTGIVVAHWKVRLPGVNGTLSVLCVLIFFAVASLSSSEAAIVTCVASFSQCLLFVKRRPLVVQVLFNISSCVVAEQLTAFTYHAPLLHHLNLSHGLCLLIAAAVFFFANTLPIAGVIALTESGSFKTIWTDSYFWSLPFHLFGSGLAALADVAFRHLGWQTSVMILPALYVIYRSFNLYIGRVQDERRHAEEISSLHLRTIEALALAIEAKDQTTANHLARVQIYAVEIGKDLGMTEREIEALRAASLLHDIGKLAVPEHIISKPGKLTREEFEKMKIHPVVGAEILERVNFPYPVTPIVRSHHEKWNGEGYPDGLQGEAIPLGARILAAVDCLDALASDRQYRKALPLPEAMAVVAGEAGKSFDPRVVEVLQRRHEELEQKTRESKDDAFKGALSVDIKIERGDAPAAGFESAAQESDPERVPSNFIATIAAARQEMQDLFEITRDLGNSLSLQDALSLFAARLEKLVPYDCIAIYLVDGETIKPEFAAGDNFRVFSSLEIPIGMGLSGWVAENAKPILNGNPAVETGHLRQPSRVTSLRSALSVPLEVGERVVGVLSLYNADKDAFSKDNLRILLSISSKLAQTVENNKRYAQAEQSAGTDYISGLPNARSLFLHLDAEVARCSRIGIPLSVIVGDLDGFKQINDHFGHLTGNRVLREVADMLRSSCRPYDYVARLGGDEFVIVVPEADQSSLTSRIADWQEAVIAIGARVSHGLPLSISFGIAHFGPDGEDSDRLLAKADQYMYEAKRKRKTPRAVEPIPMRRLA